MSRKQHLESFFEEAAELLERLEAALLDLKLQPENSELIDTVFRSLHTLKGTGAMFGFDQLANFAHKIEAIFDQVRKKKIRLDAGLIQLSLDACDFMALGLQEKITPAEVAEREKILSAAFVPFMIAGSQPPEEIDLPAAEPGLAGTKKSLWHIRFAPFGQFFHSGNDPIALLTELDSLGKAGVIVDLARFPDLSDMIPTDCYFAWDILLESTADKNAILDVFIFAEGHCELIVTEVSAPPECFVHYAPFAENSLNQPLQEVVAAAAKANAGGNTSSRAAAAESVVSLAQEAGRLIDKSVDSLKVDRLIGLLGEMVAIQARLSQVAELHSDTELMTISRELEALTGELRENTLKISMLPISSIFGILDARIKQLAQNYGRSIQAKFSGGNTEFDKGALEKLLPPIFQLLECVVSHIRSLQSENGDLTDKPADIEIGAWQASGFLYVRVSCDKATFANGASDDCWLESLQLHQAATFVNFDSVSAESVDNSLNNGLQKDAMVFKQAINELRGSVSVVSAAGRGLEIILKQPLNLAIIAGLMVKVEDGLFLIPLALVDECIELTREAQKKAYHKNVVMVRGSLVPYINFRESFSIAGEPPEIQQIVITVVENYRVGLVVDEVVGEYQTVIKKWGNFCADVPGIAGATILGDGDVALITDLPKLINEERHKLDMLIGAH